MVSPLLISAVDGVEWSDLRPGRCTPGERASVPTGYETELVPEPVWTLWKKDKSLALAGNQTPAPSL
jgi:hypothetical protein